ncbi:cell division protein DivIVA, partial [Micrococcus endophyticus]
MRAGCPVSTPLWIAVIAALVVVVAALAAA